MVESHIIADLYFNKATYRESESVLVTFTLSIALTGKGRNGLPAPLLSIRRLGRTVLSRDLPGSGMDGGPETISLGTFASGGYEVLLTGGDGASGQGASGEGVGVLAASAFDVSAGAPEVVRYAFMSDFSPCEPGERSRRDFLASEALTRLHATHIQFYDWMYRHHDLLPPTDLFDDALGRPVDAGAVRRRIALCEERGMLPVAYGAVYGAEKEFAEANPRLVLERGDGLKAEFIGIISICDISADSPWSDHIVAEFQRACKDFGFRGIHMDQYGAPKLALRSDGSLLDLEDCFAPLVDRTKQALAEGGEERFVVFNCVNAWPADFLSAARQDATYIEVWNPFWRYRHLAELARKARLLAPGRPVVLAAYLKCFLDPEESEERRESSARLSLAVICANGATQLFLGEADGVLAEGYYVNHGHRRASFEPVLRSYMDFIVKYRELLFGTAVRDESLSYAGGVNDEFRISGAPWSVEYECGTVCASIARLGAGSIVVNLVNLMGLEDERWTTGKQDPVSVNSIVLELLAWAEVEEVSCASPDDGIGSLLRLDWEYAPHPQGRCVRIAVPEIQWWSLVLVRFKARS
ncbi:MAG: glycoside hydrolase family 66 protein [Spirochaetota bacterium]